uniref:Fe2OG dioxygenase domain-containing protein n=1 Tax=Chrysotila carterae TaxID=13221 RepID=A0A7S4B649_CHRCT|mmetsp:Transcript_52921/g.115477  ORF Transcript_52921/g.115477 Transcript_52921/m.115477 type:complete len:300 (-) Transcript_52921:361-1260(-)
MVVRQNDSCQQTPAEQLCDELQSVRPQTARPKIFPLTKDGRSWIIYAANWWPSSEFDMLWAARPTERPVGHIFGKSITFPRHTQSWGIDYSYTGQIARAKPLSEAPSQVVQVLTELQQLESFKGHNQVLQNWYEAHPDAKADYIGPHSDDERELVAGSPIASLSWCKADRITLGRQPLLPGASGLPARGHWRRFRVTAKKNVTDAVVPKGGGWFDSGGATLKLHDGDLLVMGGECQRTHKHEIMKPGKDPAENYGQRINVTFRAFQTKGRNVPHKRTLSENDVTHKRKLSEAAVAEIDS